MQVYLGKEIPLFGIEELIGLPRAELPLTDFLEHSFICGAHTYGKTVLAKAIIEDFSQSGIPVVIIDNKGDMGSLGLVFPSYQPESFISWMDSTSPDDIKEQATKYSRRYLHRLKLFEINQTAIQTLTEKVRTTIFTPKNDYGIRIATPSLPPAPLQIDEFLEKEPELVLQLANCISLGFVERLYPGEKLESQEREINFLTQLIVYAWKKKIRLEGVDGIKQLLDLIQNPPAKMIGIIPADRYIMQHKRKDLGLKLNSLLFRNEQAWYSGLPLEMATLLGEKVTPGRTQISIIDLTQISSFEEQSFLIARIVETIYSWMKQKGPTNKPRLLFYIDELQYKEHSFFPKAPGNTAAKYMLTQLLANAKEHGVAVMLGATTPLNLDYKALGGCKTWMIGHQTSNREWQNMCAGLMEINLKVEQLARDSNLAKAGEFILKTKDGSSKFFHQRWITSFHRHFSPAEVTRFTNEHTFPQTTSITKEIVEDRDTVTYNKNEGILGSCLEILDGEKAGNKIYLEDGENFYGRTEFCPHNAKVSRKHFRIIKKDNDYYIKDASTNGTFIGGRRIDVRRLEPNDEIILGKNEVTLKYIKI